VFVNIRHFHPSLILEGKARSLPLEQVIIKGEVLLYHWPPFWLVWISLFWKKCQLSYSWFQTSQTWSQQYSDTSPFSIPCLEYQRGWVGWKGGSLSLKYRTMVKVLKTTNALAYFYTLVNKAVKSFLMQFWITDEKILFYWTELTEPIKYNIWLVAHQHRAFFSQVSYFWVSTATARMEHLGSYVIFVISLVYSDS
jgi:hypothetical protein